ncbi:heterokaryon incompatibility protein-domain-containing protein [Xylariaceae sp. FL0016]|nr:heterokaryon incompatibility protein-domain-containing protein [Xylariaceae sp. FL0016]
MRLINVESHELHEFFGSDIPAYAILSHTWGDEEVTFQDMQTNKAHTKMGYEKIWLTCEQARYNNLKWAWVDTCCIDKASSAELSEAINSMYQWYAKSKVCYAYLSDVGLGGENPVRSWPEPEYTESNCAVKDSSSGHKKKDSSLAIERLSSFLLDEESAFPMGRHDVAVDLQPLKMSRWFSRGWTLQELIAPSTVKFYGRGWSYLGYYTERRIEAAVCQAAGLPKKFFSSPKPLSDYSVAQKLSWAATRECTRVEDVAYSLLGLLNINMPLLYGEGEKAFKRLQEEILKGTDDSTLLAWTVPSDSPRAWTLESIFAKSPADFLQSRDVIKDLTTQPFPLAMTSRGLKMKTRLVPYEHGEASHFWSKNDRCNISMIAVRGMKDGLRSDDSLLDEILERPGYGP